MKKTVSYNQLKKLVKESLDEYSISSIAADACDDVVDYLDEDTVEYIVLMCMNGWSCFKRELEGEFTEYVIYPVYLIGKCDPMPSIFVTNLSDIFEIPEEYIKSVVPADDEGLRQWEIVDGITQSLLEDIENGDYSGIRVKDSVKDLADRLRRTAGC